MLVGGVRGGFWGRTVAARRVAGVCGCCVGAVSHVSAVTAPGWPSLQAPDLAGLTG
jgi:hypothetical protein